MLHRGKKIFEMDLNSLLQSVDNKPDLDQCQN